MKGRPIVLIVAVLSLTPAAAASQATGGHIEGSVTDSSGRPLEGARVTILGSGLPGVTSRSTNGQGRFRFEHVPVGTYEVQLRAIGYRGATFPGRAVHLGRTTHIGIIRLSPAPVQLEEILVHGDRFDLEGASTAGGGIVTAQQLEALPLERNYRSVPAILPSVNAEADGINVNGGGGLDNLWFVDGADVTDPGNGSSSTIIPHNFIKEIEVRTGGYEAEFRGALGGVVNVVTQSGGEELHGQLFGYFLNNSITGNPRVIGGEVPPGEFKHFDLGGSLGGPIARGRLWFFAAYAPAFERQSVELGALGRLVDRMVRHSFAGKLTWQPTPRTLLVGSLLGDPSWRDAVGGDGEGYATVDGLLTRERAGGTALSLNLVQNVSDPLGVSVSLSRADRLDEIMPGTELGASQVAFIDSNGVTSGGPVYRARYDFATTSAAASASLAAKTHQLKAGIAFSERRVDQTDLFHVVRQLTIAESPDYRYREADFRQVGVTRNRTFAAFVQDGWTVSSVLRLNVGLRWEGERNYGSDGDVSLSILDEVQPRLGFIVKPARNRNDRLLGSYGRYYQSLFNSLGMFYFAYGSLASVVRYPEDPRTSRAGGSCETTAVFCIHTTRVPDPGVEGQSFDEYSLGYERELSPGIVASIRGVYRNLRWAVEDAIDPATGEGRFGNPGRGALGFVPRATHRYRAIELKAYGQLLPRLWALGSYVLSSNTGNYVGLNEGGYENVNWGGAFDVPPIMRNADGRLRNDRPHVLKLNAVYRALDNVTLGGSLLYQSGAPVSEIADSANWHIYVYPRGSAGRVPAAWDLGFRASWALASADHGLRPSALLDLYHIGSPRRVLTYDEVRWFGLEGDNRPVNPNPRYRTPTSFQPPMSARIGLIAEF